MDKYIFPAIFSHEEVGGYSIRFPDLDGCFTEGNTIDEALKMSKEALELFLWNMEDDDENIPDPSLPENIKVEAGEFVVPITAYMLDIRDKMNNKAVNKNCTIPYGVFQK